MAKKVSLEDALDSFCAKYFILEKNANFVYKGRIERGKLVISVKEPEKVQEYGLPETYQGFHVVYRLGNPPKFAEKNK